MGMVLWVFLLIAVGCGRSQFLSVGQQTGDQTGDGGGEGDAGHD